MTYVKNPTFRTLPNRNRELDSLCFIGGYFNMEKICGIYKITSPTKRVYIGQSIDIKRRLRCYTNLKCEGQPRIYRSLVKHGVNKHIFSIVQTCDAKDLDALEIYYIELYQSFNNKNGLNLSSGGTSGIKSEETRLKISNALKGKKHSPERILKSKLERKPVSEETREKIRKHNIGKKYSEETKEKKRAQCLGDKNPNYGKKHTEITKAAISATHKGRKQSIQHVLLKCKKVIQYSKSDIFIAEFISTVDASNKTGINVSAICKCLNGKSKSSGGFIWKKHN